jgi:Cyclic nucleotide-binding domain
MQDDWEFCSCDLVSAAECSSAASITRVISMKAGGYSGRGSLAHPGCEKPSLCGTFTSDVGGLSDRRPTARGRNGTCQTIPIKQAIFDPKEFLANVGEGKTILEFRKDEVIFAQGDVASTVFYIQKGRVKVVVISEQATTEKSRSTVHC